MKLLRPLLTSEAGIEPVVQASPILLAIPRSGEAGEGLCVVEHSNQAGSLTLPRSAVDLITGKEHEGKVEVPGYGVMVLRYL